MPITTCHLKVLLNCLTISFTLNSNTGKYYSVAYICFNLLCRQRQKIRSRIKTQFNLLPQLTPGERINQNEFSSFLGFSPVYVTLVNILVPRACDPFGLLNGSRSVHRGTHDARVDCVENEVTLTHKF